ncbi:MAG: RtcB family protein [Deltaproteobacteria bacterium]
MSGPKPYRLVQIDDVRWEIPRTGRMRVPGLIYADSRILPDIEKDRSPEQVFNVAHLPGIVGRSMAMPDMHWGYGFPIGGVAAFDPDEGVVSPGGVGYDINCGVRLAVTGLHRDAVSQRIRELIDALFARVPCGVGSRGAIRLNKKEMSSVLKLGAQWAVANGMGDASDLDFIEDRGVLEGADPAVISDRAFERGKDQLGTLGSGNHFLEIGFVEEIFDSATAAQWGLEIGRVTLMVHSGSRGLGYQVCDEFLARMVESVRKERLELPDRQLACTRLNSSLARKYLAAMAASANFAFANRQRKGATRAFPANHRQLPAAFRSTGQPVLIPGDMGRASYVLAGEEGAMDETFGSACHGAGRLLSRHEAIRKTKGRAVERELQDAGVYPRWRGRKTIREEVPEAYKDVSLVVDVVQRAGLARRVARIHPMGVVKG